jgi:hypothetical protein
MAILKWGSSGLNLPREAIANVASIDPGEYPLFLLCFEDITRPGLAPHSPSLASPKSSFQITVSRKPSRIISSKTLTTHIHTHQTANSLILGYFHLLYYPYTLKGYNDWRIGYYLLDYMNQ